MPRDCGGNPPTLNSDDLAGPARRKWGHRRLHPCLIATAAPRCLHHRGQRGRLVRVRSFDISSRSRKHRGLRRQGARESKRVRRLELREQPGEHRSWWQLLRPGARGRQREGPACLRVSRWLTLPGFSPLGRRIATSQLRRHTRGSSRRVDGPGTRVMCGRSSYPRNENAMQSSGRRPQARIGT